MNTTKLLVLVSALCFLLGVVAAVTKESIGLDVGGWVSAGLLSYVASKIVSLKFTD